VRVTGRDAFELTAGAAYVSTAAGATEFVISTPMGTLRDRGTQFEVRLAASSLRVRVRTGHVEIQRGNDVVQTAAGTETTVTQEGIASRAVPVYGPAWAWTVRLAPPFDIENKPLSAFLDYAAREQGWTIRYSDASLAREASTILLHGSVSGLQPEEAVAVAVTTSGLKYRLRDGELFVFRSGGER
jgi:ferric-dicitrate binding protein FerR (iron transport regulator)